MDLGLLYHPFFTLGTVSFGFCDCWSKCQREVEFSAFKFGFLSLFPDALFPSLFTWQSRVTTQLESKEFLRLMPDAKRAFARLSQFNSGVRHLAVKDLIDPKRLRDGKVIRTSPSSRWSRFRDSERNKEGILLSISDNSFFLISNFTTERSSSANRPIDTDMIFKEPLL